MIHLLILWDICWLSVFHPRFVILTSLNQIDLIVIDKISLYFWFISNLYSAFCKGAKQSVEQYSSNFTIK